jgi:hypothetical protein
MERVEHLTELNPKKAKKGLHLEMEEGWVSRDSSQGIQPHTESRTSLRSRDVCPISYQH